MQNCSISSVGAIGSNWLLGGNWLHGNVREALLWLDPGVQVRGLAVQHQHLWSLSPRRARVRAVRKRLRKVVRLPGKRPPNAIAAKRMPAWTVPPKVVRQDVKVAACIPEDAWIFV